MKDKFKNNQKSQLLLVTGVLLATTILLIGEFAINTITLGVESNIERSHSFSWEYLIVKEKFVLAFDENVKSLNKYYKNTSVAIETAFEQTNKQFENVEAYYGIIFSSKIKNITKLENRNFGINFSIIMQDSNTIIEENIYTIVELYASDEWWENNEKWHYRIPIIVNTQITDAFVEKRINFTKELNDFGKSIFDENSIRVIEYNKNGMILCEIPSHFNRETDYDSNNNAIVKIRWFANGTNNNTRYYYIYFDSTEIGLKNETVYTSLLANPILSSKIILEDKQSIYNFTPTSPISIENRLSGFNSFNSNGNCYFENFSLGIIDDDNTFISLWLYFNNSHSDLLFSVQLNNSLWLRWGFDSDQIFNGTIWNESIKGNTTDIHTGNWNYFNINLIDDLGIYMGSNITGLGFFSDDVFYDHVVFEDIIVENIEQKTTIELLP